MSDRRRCLPTEAPECRQAYRQPPAGEELAGLSPGVVGKLLDEVLVGAAKNVRRHALVRETVFIKMLYEGVDDFVRDQRLAGTVWRRLAPVHRKDAAQLVVGVSDRAHCLSEHVADVC